MRNDHNKAYELEGGDYLANDIGENPFQNENPGLYLCG